MLKNAHTLPGHEIQLLPVCFKGGYIDAWGRGTLKIINACKQAELPEPEIKEQDGGLLVTLFKDSFTEEHLLKLGLSERQIKAVLYVKEKGRISNNIYQKLFSVAKATATRDLHELVKKWDILKKEGNTGAGTFYILKAY